MSLRRAFLSRVASLSKFNGDEVAETAAADEIEGGEVDGVVAPTGEEDGDRWERMLPELIGEIVRRVEAAGDRWPFRKDVVSCACLCRRWREVTIGTVRPLPESGKITFPSSLKEVTSFAATDFGFRFVPLGPNLLMEMDLLREAHKNLFFAYEIEILITFMW